jgi:proline iminopeptidase
MARVLYPVIEPIQEGHLDVGNGHLVFYAVYGNPLGTPAIFLHGGPGAGCDERSPRFFDPSAYKIVIFDQRGCGRSTPLGGLEHNTTWDLVSDVEVIRRHVTVDSWVVFGGSWGCTLALLYAEMHPQRVKALVLRGICMLRQSEIHWLYQEGANFIFPDAWEHFLEPIPHAERGNLLAAYHKRLTSDDDEERSRAAKFWAIWEEIPAKLHVDHSLVASCSGDDPSVAIARIESHYFINSRWWHCPFARPLKRMPLTSSVSNTSICRVLLFARRPGPPRHRTHPPHSDSACAGEPHVLRLGQLDWHSPSFVTVS